MTLMSVYQTATGLEILLCLLAGAVLVISLIFTACMLSESYFRDDRKALAIAIAVFVVSSFALYFATTMENHTVYEYHVTDPVKVEEKLDLGYKIYDNTGTKYSLVKEE